MSLEASERLIDIICVNWRCTCGCILRPTFKLSASLLDIIKNQKKSAKTSTSLVHPWGQFPNAWMYHVHLYKQWYASINTMGPLSRHTTGRRRVLSPRDERTLVRKVQINPRTTAKDLVKMLEETGTKVSISTVKMSQGVGCVGSGCRVCWVRV